MLNLLKTKVAEQGMGNDVFESKSSEASARIDQEGGGKYSSELFRLYKR